MQRNWMTLVVSVAAAILLASSMATSVVLAHPEDGSLDGNVSTTENGLVEVPPFMNSTIDNELYATHFRVRADGSASVTVLVSYHGYRWEKQQYPYSDMESEEYQLFEDEVVGVMDTLAADASEKTGREMVVTLDRTNHGYDRAEGYTLQFEFTWTNFAEVHENGMYVVTEPFSSAHPVLMHGHDSQIHWTYSTVSWEPMTNNPEPYEVELQNATGGVRQDFDGVRFSGLKSEHTMSGGRVVFSPEDASTPTATVTASPTASPTPSSTPTEPASSEFPLWVLGVLFVVLVLIGAVWRRQR